MVCLKWNILFLYMTIFLSFSFLLKGFFGRVCQNCSPPFPRVSAEADTHSNVQIYQEREIERGSE